MRPLILAITTLFVAAPALAAHHGPTPTTAPTSPKQLFNPVALHTIHLSLTPEAWQLIQPGGRGARPPTPKKPATRATSRLAATRPTEHIEGARLRPGPAGYLYGYVLSQVDFDGQTVDDAGVRFKGNSSYGVSGATPRRPMKLQFDRFVDGNRFAGVATLNLNPQVFDPSQLREAVAFDLFRELGVPSPRTTFALVYLTIPGLYDHEYLGLYTLIEEVDDKFLKRHFDDDEGLLCKPEAIRGLPYFGPEWSQFVMRYKPHSEVFQDDARQIIDLARLINKADDSTFRANIPRLLNVDEFLRYVAVNAAICNFDSYLSTGHNYYLYVDPADHRVNFLPWDMNLSFGAYSWLGSTQETARTSITRAYADHNRLIERLLAFPDYSTTYRGYLRQLADGPLAPAAIRARVASFQPIFDRAAQTTRDAKRENSPTTRPAMGMGFKVPDLLTFIDLRTVSIRRQLDGKEEGFLPAFRDPAHVPTHMVPVVGVAYAVMNALDDDHDGRFAESAIVSAIDRLYADAHQPPGSPLDRAAVTAALDHLLPANVRHFASPNAWTTWLFRLADANHDQRLTTDELLTAYRRHLVGSDRDLDNLMDGRELVEAFVGAGAPKE